MGEGYYFCCKALLVCIWRNGTKYSWHFAIRGCKCRMQRHETHFFLSFWLLSDRCSAVPTRLLDYFSLPEWPRPRKAASKKRLKNYAYILTVHFAIWKSGVFLQFLLLANKARGALLHGVWKSQKKSHSIWRAKRATFTFWVDESSLKMPKKVPFGEFLKTWNLQSNNVTR